MEDEFGKVLRLAPDCDPTALEIDPTEGFLLSRIDGRTPWRVLREMGAMSPEEVDLCLEGWIARGLVCVDDAASERDRLHREKRREQERSARRARSEAAEAVPTSLDESAVDESLDLDVGIQRRILEFELRLACPYHELLDVAPDANAKDIKRAYFKLSKEFHPDRYFRRQIGSFAQRLDRIFKKVTEAYELLSDPTTRAEVERSMRGAAPAPNAPPTAGGDGAAAAPQRPLTKLERLRQRMPFRLPESVLAERRRKAAEFFEAAKISDRRGQHTEAAQNVRLAIAFDPFEDEYKRAFADIQARATAQRAERLLAETDGLDAGQLKKAMGLLEDVLLYRPHDPELNHRAALVALELGEVEKAREYVGVAIEHCPEVARHHVGLAKVHLAAREKGHAIHALERALKLDPKDDEARRLLASLRLRASGATGGMR